MANVCAVGMCSMACVFKLNVTLDGGNGMRTRFEVAGRFELGGGGIQSNISTIPQQTKKYLPDNVVSACSLDRFSSSATRKSASETQRSR